MNKRIILFLFVVLMACGCASKRYAKKAKELEKAGLYMDAAEMYYRSAKANRDNVDAKIGLRMNGQLALNKKLDKFKHDYLNRDTKAAVYSFQDALAYEKKIESVGIRLDIPADIVQYYKEVKETYLDGRYFEAITAMDREDFAMASDIFTEIKRFDSNYRDVNSQLVIARYEPLYRRANDELKNGMFRSAYYSFDKVLKGTGGHYKEADLLRKEAQDRAMITVAVMPFDAPRFTQAQTADFSNKIISNIKHHRSPFISFRDYRMVNRSSYIGHGIDIRSARAAGIKAIIIGRVVNYYVHGGIIHSEKKQVFVKHIDEYKDKHGLTQKKVSYERDKYIEYYASNSVELAIEYQMISTETGEVIYADSFSQRGGDAIRFARYNGSYKKLVPGSWKRGRGRKDDEKIHDDKHSVRKLHRLFRERDRLVPVSKISNDLENMIAGAIAKSVVSYNPER